MMYFLPILQLPLYYLFRFVFFSLIIHILAFDPILFSIFSSGLFAIFCVIVWR